MSSDVDPSLFTLIDALYVLDLVQRSGGTYLLLLNVRLAFDFGLNFTFTSSRDFINHPFGLNVTIARHSGLTWAILVLLLATASPSRDLFNRRYGDLHESGLLKLESLGVLGVSGFSKLSPIYIVMPRLRYRQVHCCRH